jgi:hypothetical protein
MNVTHGMNLEEVRDLGRLLQQKASEIQQLLRDVEARIGATGWVGPDASTFRDQWWPEHRSRLNNVSTDLHGFGQSALNNASEQEQVSLR